MADTNEASAGGMSVEATVQNELQQYLNEKGVNSLFIKIVENLLLAKPENPIAFIVDYLMKNFPKETEEFMKKSDAAKMIPAPMEEQQETKEEEDSSDEDDEEDYFDETEELAPLASKPAEKRTRRQSVSAGVLAVESLSDKKVVFPKSKEEAEKLKKIISETMLCSHLDDAAKDTVVDAMEKQVVEADVEIITQGDTVAEHYYVLEKGSACVVKDGEKVLDYADGSDFGELALMYNAPRAATVKTTSKCELWRLDQNSFKVIVMGSAMKKREKYNEFLSNVPIFKEMEATERNTLADALKEKEFKKGEVVVTQGEPGDEFFIIAEGVVNVHVNGECIGDLNEGKYFGEIALLTPKPRQATIIASSPTIKLLSVHRKVFERVLGNLEDILKRNIKSYSQYVAGVQA